MKYLDEYRDGRVVRSLARELDRVTTRPWTLMEVCGGQTHSIVRYGIDQLLPSRLTLVHGPGCPVCVTPLEQIDQALTIAARPEVIFCTFGDMLRVPGSAQDLFLVKASGGDVRMVYSPLDCLRLARENPRREVVFFAVGFETTAPATAAAVVEAAKGGLANFSALVAHVRVPPAMEAILAAPDQRVEGFLAAGHVCSIMGTAEYHPIAARYQTPIVVTGFEPVDLLEGILCCVDQLEKGRHEVVNQYRRSVRTEGNPAAQALLREVFEVVPRKWRGLGEIPASGLALSPRYRAFDADQRFPGSMRPVEEPAVCISGLIMQGLRKPTDCAAFGTECRPEAPLGAPMVSSEGACAAYYRYRGAPLASNGGEIR
jgi:hydrogenase expression/formation protein HypD